MLCCRHVHHGRHDPGRQLNWGCTRGCALKLGRQAGRDGARDCHRGRGWRRRGLGDGPGRRRHGGLRKCRHLDGLVGRPLGRLVGNPWAGRDRLGDRHRHARRRFVHGAHHRPRRQRRRQTRAQIRHGDELRRRQRLQRQVLARKFVEAVWLAQQRPFALERADAVASLLGLLDRPADLAVEQLGPVLRLIKIKPRPGGQKHADAGEGADHAVGPSWKEG